MNVTRVTTATRAFAQRHAELLNAGCYGELPTLFGADAVFLGPGERELRGREQIGAFYRGFLPTVTPQVRLATFIEQGDVCGCELKARTAHQDTYRLSAIDHATLGVDGLVTRFTVHTK